MNACCVYTYIYARILLSHEKEQSLVVCREHDGPQGNYAKEIRQRKKIPYDFTYMWNLKTKQNEQT